MKYFLKLFFLYKQNLSFSASVAVAVAARDYFTKAINCNRDNFCCSTSLLQLRLDNNFGEKSLSLCSKTVIFSQKRQNIFLIKNAKISKKKIRFSPSISSRIFLLNSGS